MNTDFVYKFIDEGMLNVELRRLQELKDLNILDTERETNYDKITNLVKNMLDVPIVLISFVDADRQWFKSCIGLTVDGTSREVSFCSDAIKENNLLYIVEDTLESDKYKNNPLVLGYPNIRFYMGCTLYSPNKYRLGTLCVIDNKPKIPTTKQKELLKQFGYMVEIEIANNYIYSLMSSEQITQEKLRNIIHDVKNYMTFNISLIDIITEDESKPLSEYDEFFILLKESAKKNLKKLKDLLNYNRITNEDYEIQYSEICTLTYLHEIFRNYKVNFEINYKNLINLDKYKIEEVLINLYMNALNYSNKNNITITCEEKENDIIFGIRDVGPGIPKENHNKLFKKFSNNLSSRKCEDSTGLGLFLCKCIINKHKGEIWLDTEYSDGCFFKFSIPKNCKDL